MRSRARSCRAPEQPGLVVRPKEPELRSGSGTGRHAAVSARLLRYCGRLAPVLSPTRPRRGALVPGSHGQG